MVSYRDVYKNQTDHAVMIVDSHQHWTPENPCEYCGSTNNTSHHHACLNYGLYSEQGFPISAIPKKDSMDELVYFSASYLCIPLSKADEIRRILLDASGEHEVSFTYSNTVLEDD